MYPVYESTELKRKGEGLKYRGKKRIRKKKNSLHYLIRDVGVKTTAAPKHLSMNRDIRSIFPSTLISIPARWAESHSLSPLV